MSEHERRFRRQAPFESTSLQMLVRWQRRLDLDESTTTTEGLLSSTVPELPLEVLIPVFIAVFFVALGLILLICWCCRRKPQIGINIHQHSDPAQNQVAPLAPNGAIVESKVC